MRMMRRLFLSCFTIALLAVIPAAASAAPVNTTPPSVTGTAEAGQMLIATEGTWSGATTVGGEWMACTDDEFDPNDCDPLTSYAPQFVLLITPGLLTDHEGEYVMYVESGYGDNPPDDLVSAASNAIGPLDAPEPRPFWLYFTDTPPWWGPDASAIFGVGAEEVDPGTLTFTCVLDPDSDDPVPQDCDGGSATIDGPLSPGEHVFTVTADDGNENSESLSYTWTVSGDINTRFTETPDPNGGGEEADRPYFEWQTAGDPDGVECKLDSESWYDCTDFYGEADLRIYTSGEHTFSIRAYTQDGETRTYQDEPTTFTWTVDITPPTITASIPQIVTTDPFHVDVSTDEPLGSINCDIDEEPVIGCSHGFDISGLAATDDDGDPILHSVAIEVEDVHGNSASRYFEFTIDLGATIAVFNPVPPRFTSSSSVTVNFEGSTSGATFECQLNGGPRGACSSPLTLDGLSSGGEAEGWNELGVWATKDGRTQRVPTVASWRVTDHPLGMYWEGTPNGWTTSTDAYFRVDFDADFGDGEYPDLTCSLDGAAPVPCGGKFEFHGLAPDHHTVTVHGTLGGYSEDLSYDWTVLDEDDTTTAGVWWDQSPDGWVTTNSSASLSWSSTEGVDRVECKLDEADWAVCEEGEPNPGYVVLNGLASRSHTFSVRSFNGDDEEGNTITASWTVDNVAPVLSVGTIVPVTSQSQQLPVTSSEPVDYAECQYDGGASYACGLPLTARFMGEGQHTLQVSAWDKAGNESDPVTLVFTVQQPATPITTPVTTPPAPAAERTGVQKPKMVGKRKKFKASWLCAESKCTISAKLAIGKRSIKFRSKVVEHGNGTVTFKLTKSNRNWIKRHAGRGRKATFKVTITSATTKSSAKLRF
jgi:hypothetical protein